MYAGVACKRQSMPLVKPLRREALKQECLRQKKRDRIFETTGVWIVQGNGHSACAAPFLLIRLYALPYIVWSTSPRCDAADSAEKRAFEPRAKEHDLRFPRLPLRGGNTAGPVKMKLDVKVRTTLYYTLYSQGHGS